MVWYGSSTTASYRSNGSLLLYCYPLLDRGTLLSSTVRPPLLYSNLSPLLSTPGHPTQPGHPNHQVIQFNSFIHSSHLTDPTHPTHFISLIQLNSSNSSNSFHPSHPTHLTHLFNTLLLRRLSGIDSSCRLNPDIPSGPGRPSPFPVPARPTASRFSSVSRPVGPWWSTSALSSRLSSGGREGVSAFPLTEKSPSQETWVAERVYPSYWGKNIGPLLASPAGEKKYQHNVGGRRIE
jgi:hypothetical protein